MKKVIFGLLMFILLINETSALENLEQVNLVSCEDATTFVVEKDEKVKIIRLLGLEVPSGSKTVETDNYVCELVKKAAKLEIEYDPNSSKTDKYNHDLVYLYVDGISLANELIKKGYAQVNYIYGDYLHTDEYCQTQSIAIKEKLGIWNYPDIKEEYCKSGIIIDNKEELEEQITEKTPKDDSYLKKMLLINSLIVIFLLILFKGRKN